MRRFWLVYFLCLCKPAVSASLAIGNYKNELSPRSKSDYVALEDEKQNESIRNVEVTKPDDHNMGPLGFKIKKEDRDEGSWWLSRMLPQIDNLLPRILKPIQIGPFSLPKFPFYTISLA
eukprot:TRINITY_DN17504_c0_g1_i1.p1 TRINITY_DN17504_c0_g1~~TRINITY_DN17504_c0_g1_i1.p1  ORF type:complete len:119 (-),score=26.35 TRINITY_DN17504_c0_g1_i1:38-394(-)